MDHQKPAETQLKIQNELLAKTAKGEPLADILNAIVEAIENSLEDAASSILLLNQDNKLRLGAAPSLPAGYSNAIDGTEVVENVGPCTRAALRNETVIVENIATTSFSQGYKDLALAYDLHACWSTPITGSDGHVLGTFAIYYQQVQSPQVHELELIAQMAHIAGIAIERQQAEERLHKSEQVLRKAQQVAHVGNWEFDIPNQTITWSPELFRLYGLSPNQTAPSYPDYLQMIQPEDRVSVKHHVEQAIATGLPDTVEYRIIRPDGSLHYLECRIDVEKDGQGNVRCLLGTTVDVTVRKQAELTMQNLVAGTSMTGPDFFPALVLHISAALNVPMAFVTQFVDQKLQSLAFCMDGELQPNIIYDLPSTPCSEVLVQDPYHCPQNFSEYFPNHPHLLQGMESYLGVALRDRQGQVLGSLCILDRQPFRNPAQAKQILNIFGSRAAAELERQRAESALQNLIAGTAALTGPDFFPALVSHIAEAISVSYALVSEWNDNQLHTLAFWANGSLQTNLSYDPVQTPCEVTLKTGSFYCEHSVQQRFPQDLDLVEMGAESYLGIALKDAKGQTIGDLCILNQQVIPDPHYTEQILKVFATRASAELERQHSEIAMKLQLAAIEAAIDGIGILKNNIFIYVNQAYLDLFGYDHPNNLVGKHWKRLYPDDEVSRIEEQVCPLLLQNGAWKGETTAVRQDGTTFAQGMSLSLADDDLMISVCRDISELKQAQAQIIHNALHDPLTGLPNRALLSERLELAISRSQRSQQYRYAVLFIDLDRFKVINDSLGHMVGDQLLIETARRLQQHLRPSDLVARLGGDEFLILLEDFKATEDVVRVAERILEDGRTSILVNEHRIFMSVSIGIVLDTHQYGQAGDLIRDADIAMYRAKSERSNSYKFFDAEMHIQAVQRLTLEADLYKALDQSEFTLHYQPIIALSDRALVGFEALVRWQHPTRGLVPPNDFIPIAEETGLILSLSHWVLQEACEQMARWQSSFSHLPALKMSINLSAQDLSKANLVQAMDKILASTGLKGHAITLEITESMLIDDINQTIQVLNQLADRQIQFSIDDFGTGYSSLNYLHRLPVDNLKIDRSFVNQQQAEGTNHGVVNTIIALSEQLGLTTVAEGIETEEQLQYLRHLGCQLGQGSLFAKALTVEEVESRFFQSGIDQPPS